MVAILDTVQIVSHSVPLPIPNFVTYSHSRGIPIPIADPIPTVVSTPECLETRYRSASLTRSLMCISENWRLTTTVDEELMRGLAYGL